MDGLGPSGDLEAGSLKLNLETKAQSLSKPLLEDSPASALISLAWDWEIERDISSANVERLHQTDLKTVAMTADEYMVWSEYRHASFTRRRAKKFREWSGLGIIAEHRSSDDVLDILGFLTSEMVQHLTTLALAFREQEQMHQSATALQGNAVRESRPGLFSSDRLDPVKLPLEPHHIRRAFEAVQKRYTSARKGYGLGESGAFSSYS